VSSLSTLLQHSPGIPNQNKTRTRKKGIQIRKEKVKLSLFVDDMILYLKDPEKLHQKTRHINTFSKVEGYKINLQKSVAFLYTNNAQTEKECGKTILFNDSPKKVKMPGNKLNKGSQCPL
jgi:hypothetical protein